MYTVLSRVAFCSRQIVILSVPIVFKCRPRSLGTAPSVPITTGTIFTGLCQSLVEPVGNPSHLTPHCPPCSSVLTTSHGGKRLPPGFPLFLLMQHRKLPMLLPWQLNMLSLLLHHRAQLDVDRCEMRASRLHATSEVSYNRQFCPSDEALTHNSKRILFPPSILAAHLKPSSRIDIGVWAC
ncbi:uncharacterized protein LOC134296685 isoform X3 [Anolis carolinensis]|uniref:uncharacterized protein LOC134296685 isoform X3 n=1 Tax=Anolis carolinensis TaxID=28377 RepID=UPI002F2B3680